MGSWLPCHWICRLDSKGLEGLESQYDNQLNGNKHVWYAARDPRGREIVENVSSQEEMAPDIVLTLDKHVQHIVETELGRASKVGKSKRHCNGTPRERLSGHRISFSFQCNQFLQYRAKTSKFVGYV